MVGQIPRSSASCGVPNRLNLRVSGGITVRHNGELIHDDVELPKGTGAGGGRPEKPEGLIYLQGHGNPVAFRNFWIKERS